MQMLQREAGEPREQHQRESPVRNRLGDPTVSSRCMCVPRASYRCGGHQQFELERVG